MWEEEETLLEAEPIAIGGTDEEIEAQVNEVLGLMCDFIPDDEQALIKARIMDAAKVRGWSLELLSPNESNNSNRC